MTKADIEHADSLRAQAGWNQTLDDWLRLLNYQPDGCFVAEQNETVLGTVTTTCYGRDLAWIGMLLVHPDYRRHGIGSTLLKTALDYLQGISVRCIKLDATPLGMPIYERLGFKAEWSMQRWEANPPDYPGREIKFRTWKMRYTDKSAIMELDRAAFGVCRWGMLCCINEDASRWLVNESPKGRVNGYGFVRKGTHAVYLGPLVAEHLSAAGALIKSLCQPLARKRVYWDIPDHQASTMEIAQRLGFHPQRPLVRMYLGEQNVPGNPRLIHAIAGPEIG